MDPETFIMRKKILEEFYNIDRVNFLNACKVITVGNFTAHNRRFDGNFSIDTEVYLKKEVLKNYCKFIKPLIYFLYSFTYQEKFLQNSILIIQNIQINYYYNNPFESSHFNGCLSFLFISSESTNLNFLNRIKINNYVKGINEIKIKLLTFYYNINYDQYITLGGIIEDIDDNGEYEEHVTGEIKIINSSQTFKSEECIICLTNPPQVLFCNCGHIPICTECYKLKSLSTCPICKTENEIIRMLE